MANTRNADYAALLLRVSSGLLLLAHGLMKAVVFTPAGTAQFFESIGFPGFLAYLVILAEVGGGALMVAGVFTRWIALALVPVMLGALQVHAGNGWLFSAPGGGWEFPAFWTAALIAQFLLGDGAYALRLSGTRKAAHA